MYASRHSQRGSWCSYCVCLRGKGTALNGTTGQQHVIKCTCPGCSIWLCWSRAQLHLHKMVPPKESINKGISCLLFEDHLSCVVERNGLTSTQWHVWHTYWLPEFGCCYGQFNMMQAPFSLIKLLTCDEPWLSHYFVLCNLITYNTVHRSPTAARCEILSDK